MNQSPLWEIDQSCTPFEQLNMLLKLNLIHLQNEARGEFQDKMFVCPNEVNRENSVSIPTHANNIEYEPDIEVHEWNRDTRVLNGALHPCYNDDDNDLMLEEHIYSENVAVKSSVTVTLNSVAATLKNDVSSDFLIRNSEILDDIDMDLGIEQLFCGSVHDTQLASDLGMTEFFIVTDDLMLESNFYVSKSLPRSKCVVSSDFLMHEMETLDDYDTELGFVDLCKDCEHDNALLVSDWEKTRPRTDNCEHKNEHNLDVCSSLPVSQIDDLSSNLELVCNKIVKTTFLRVPNLGLELCASQVLLDYFAAKYNTFEEPQLECLSLPVLNKVHFELDLVHDAPPKLLEFVSKNIAAEKFRFGGSLVTLSVSLAVLCCCICVIRLLMFLHIIFWVDPQLFRLYIYGDFFLYIIQ
ncbi:uncharacterized protein LOC113317828 [Papaver somniferum]|uniref:uncharacterized protein LOC113317828 n=1 Tax=Papaver somniferum TaxID=3469 RepID=UPI000E6FAFA5|nr:uncharacterized protein LOC113317828 [Papaver somniferum]